MSLGVPDDAWQFFDADEKDGVQPVTPGQISNAMQGCDVYASNTLMGLNDVNLAFVISISGETVWLCRFNVGAVCRRLHAVIGQDLGCWRRLRLNPPSDISHRTMTDDLVVQLVRAQGWRLLEIDFDGADHLTSVSISQLAHHCPKLKSISLVGCLQVSLQSLYFLIKSCPHLEVLRIARSEGPLAPGNLTATTRHCWGQADINAQIAAEHCPKLRKLWLSQLSQDESVSMLFERCRDIVDFRLAACMELPCGHVFQCALESARMRLESLQLWKCSRLADISYLTCLPRLRQLHLADCVGLTDESGLDVVVPSTASTLLQLVLTGCRGLTPVGLAAIFNKVIRFEVLESLFLGSTKLTDSICGIIGQVCPTVSHLDLWNVRELTDAGVKELLSHGMPVRQLNLRENRKCSGTVLDIVAKSDKGKLLDTLDVTWIGDTSDDDMIPFFEHYDNAGLSAFHCGGRHCSITNTILQYIPSTLTTLEFDSCESLTDLRLLARLKDLKSLSLVACKASPEQMIHVFSSVSLNYLSFPKCTLDDHALQTLAVHSPGLVYLNVEEGEGFTDDGINTVARFCRRLAAVIK